MAKFIGISLSLCVRDVLEGKVSRDQIAYIIPGFNWPGLDVWQDDAAFSLYLNSYWKGFDRETVLPLLQSLEFRTSTVPWRNISNGYWCLAAGFSDAVLVNPLLRFRTEDLT